MAPREEEAELEDRMGVWPLGGVGGGGVSPPADPDLRCAFLGGRSGGEGCWSSRLIRSRSSSWRCRHASRVPVWPFIWEEVGGASPAGREEQEELAVERRL